MKAPVSRRVYKYPIPLRDDFQLLLPRGAAILDVQMQRGAPQLWALVDTSQPLVERVFRLAGTGHPLTSDDTSQLEHCGSFQMQQGALIFISSSWSRRAADARRNAQAPREARRLAAVMAHTCHARGCTIAVPPKMLMCRRHWFLVPKALRDAVWRTYHPGQERTKDPTSEYLAAAHAAIEAVAE